MFKALVTVNHELIDAPTLLCTGFASKKPVRERTHGLSNWRFRIEKGLLNMETPRTFKKTKLNPIAACSDIFAADPSASLC